MNKILELILPTIASSKVNKNLKLKNQQSTQGILQYTNDGENITIASLKQKYKDTYDAKNKLEDKAKTNVIGITIAITLIMGSVGILSTIEAKYSSIIFQWVAFLMFFIAILYLLVAGILAIKVLCNENIMYDISLKSLSQNDNESKYEYDECIAKNKNQNLIRNNMIFSSYACIRNAIFCMIVIFILVAFPFSHQENRDMLSSTNFNQTYFYSHSTLEYIENDDNINIVEALIANDLKTNKFINDNEYRNFVSQEYELFIKYKYTNGVVIVELVEPFDSK